LFPEHANNETELLGFADIAKHQAKQLGCDKGQVYSSSKI
jgi:hypothetical protein